MEWQSNMMFGTLFFEKKSLVMHYWHFTESRQKIFFIDRVITQSKIVFTILGFFYTREYWQINRSKPVEHLKLNIPLNLLFNQVL